MKLLLIDGSNLIFRAYYATENNPVKNLEGVRINAVTALIRMIDKILKDHKPTHVFIALDNGKSTFRHKLFEDYKGKRVATPEQLKEQFPIILEYFNALGIVNYATDEYEADDLIASYAKKAQQQNIEVQIISGDKDLLQLIDTNISVLTPKIGFAKECNYDQKIFFEKYGFTPNRFIEYKSLIGDPSDNIKGIEKVGDKTAKKLIINSSSIKEIIQNAQDGIIKGKVGENISNNKEMLLHNLELVTLIEDIDLEITIDKLQFSKYKNSTYLEFLKKQGLINLYHKVAKNNNIDIAIEKIEYEEITEFNTQEHTSEITYLYTQTLTENYIYSENLGIALTSQKGNYYLNKKNINQEFINFLNSESKKVFYNAKMFMVSIGQNNLKGYYFDIYSALALINYENYKKNITNNLLNYQITNLKPEEEIFGSKTKPKIPDDIEILKQNLINKVIGIEKVFQTIKKEINELSLDSILYEIEMPLTEVLIKVELNGINIDILKLEKLKRNYEYKVEEITKELFLYSEVNINSTKQLSTLLFEEWKLPKKGLKKTTSAISTDLENLEKLLYLLNEDNNKNYQKEILFIQKIIEYRKLTKILKTYLLNIESFLKDNQKIYPINHQLLTETGRLSVMDPNIQNIPARSKEGKEIRKLFVPSKNNKIIAFDYSQIELRVIAHLSGDENMIEAFNNDRDIHTETAKKMFATNEITPMMRSKAKAINFGIIYGMSPYGLAKQLEITNAEAKDFIDKYFEEFPGIKNYINNTILKVKEEDEIKTIYGRIRKIKNINSKNFKEQEHAKRVAINTPIQGSAADIMKSALIHTQDKILQENWQTKIIMQIHDEIIFEVPEDEVLKILEEIPKIMENVINLKIKLKTEVAVGENWLDAK